MHSINRNHHYYRTVLAQDLLLKGTAKTIYQLPVLDAIVVHSTSKWYATEDNQLIAACAILELTTGQKPTVTAAKTCIAGFHLRTGQLLGCRVTLRRAQMYNFLDLLTNVVLPQYRDFTGIPPLSHKERTLSRTGYGERGTLSFGLDHLLAFPQLEDHYELFHQIRGVDITLASRRSNPMIHRILMSGLQLPCTQ